MKNRFSRAFRGFFLSLMLILPAFPAQSDENPAYVAALSQALELMRADRWDEAFAAAGGAGTIRRDIILWHYLRASKGDFAQAQDFLARRADWPGLKLLRKRSEAAIPEDAAPGEVLAFFAAEGPQTGTGVMRMARALEAQGKVEEARAQVVLAWFSMLMTSDEEAALLDAYGAVLQEYHWQRLDMLLWRGELAAARRMVPLVDAAHQKLARARILLRGRENGVDAAIEAVPAALKGDPGLAYERFLWRAAKGRNQSAIDLMLERSASAAMLGEPGRWGSWRRTLARWSMREGKARQAYRLAANHHIAEGASRNDLEWLAGYIALRKLNDPEVALRHFQAFRAGVESPISLGRAGYWLGRAYEALGRAEEAGEAYRFGAQYQTSFYGQLAAEKAGVPMDPALLGRERFGGWEQAAFWNDSRMVAMRLLQAANERYLALRFGQQLSEELGHDDIGRMLGWAESVGAGYLQVKLAKYLVRTRKMMFVRAYYALVDLPERAGVPPEFALSIMRRESEFNPTVRSSVGAAGLMQLMPGTARDMARQLGIGYNQGRLISDPAYNIRLGQEYLAWLFTDYGPNPVIVAVAYNAGPGRARQWVAARGHPGAREVNAVDWIEHIPFRETRNYVMRVTEGLAPYRARRAGRVLPLTLRREIGTR